MGAVLVSSLLFAGCGGGSAATEAGQPLVSPKPSPEAARGGTGFDGGDSNVTDLIAGQNHDAGDITVTNDGDNLFITYTLEGDWTMSEAHLYVGTTYPKKNAPGQFPYKVSDLGGVTEYTFTVPLGDWDCGTDLIIAAHAVVTDGAVGGFGEQTGWGFGPEGFTNKWGWYMHYTIDPYCPLPTNTLNFKVQHPNGPISYFLSTFTGIGAGFGIADNTGYPGWCVDLFHNITPGTTYQAKVYSSYDGALPGDLQDSDWDMVNYLLNNKQGSRDDIQNAIWYFIGGGAYPSDPDAQAMIADALANGEGFVPGAGQITAVVVDPVQNVQVTIIEFECEC